MTETARGWLSGGSVGFVPIAASLHIGHLTLVQAARQECQICIVSIFVNSMRFNSSQRRVAEASQTRNYSDLEQDLQLLHRANVDVVFVPRPEDFYPSNFSTFVAPSGVIAQGLGDAGCQAYFREVATTITKLFQLVRPDVAYFGQKDAQQAAVIRQLVRDLNIDINIRVLPTMRESDGLAMSSRNRLLSTPERKAARVLYRALLLSKALIENGERTSAVIKKSMADLVARESLVELDSVAICHPGTLEELQEVAPGTLFSISVRIGSIHLIDSILWQSDGQWVM